MKHERAFEVERILRVSRRRNAALGVTGALVSTVDHFAQVLEGDQTAVDELMQSITCDSRHHEVRVVMNEPAPNRLFSQWELAYAGPSAYLNRYTATVAESPEPRTVREFVKVIRQFTGNKLDARRDRNG